MNQLQSTLTSNGSNFESVRTCNAAVLLRNRFDSSEQHDSICAGRSSAIARRTPISKRIQGCQYAYSRVAT